MIVFFIIAIGCVVAGYFLSEFINIKKCSGEIIMYDDNIYLNINKENINNFEDGKFVMLRIKRKNFKGFNEEL